MTQLQYMTTTMLSVSRYILIFVVKKDKDGPKIMIVALKSGQTIVKLVFTKASSKSTVTIKAIDIKGIKASDSDRIGCRQCPTVTILIV